MSKIIKRIAEPKPSFIKSQLPEIRTKILVGQKSEIHNKLMEYINTLDFKYGTQDEEILSGRPPHIGKIFKIKCTKDHLPEGLDMLINYCSTDRRIPMEEVSGMVVSIYPPPKIISSYENLIEAALMVTRDRFIYFANSDEMLEYKMIDPAKLQQMIGMPIPKNTLQTIPEHVERGHMYHMTQTSAVSLSLRYNDEKTFLKRADRNGSRDSYLEKRPLVRYIVVIDFLMTNDIFRASMKRAASVIGDVAETDTTVKGKMAEKVLERMAEDMNETEDEIPELISEEKNELLEAINGNI